MCHKILAEVCCASLEDALCAQRCGADRIELVSAHSLGGLTPSLGLLQLVKQQVDIPVMAIIRPRMSGFCYSTEDYAVMCRDAELMLEAGADGIVFGFLNSDGQIDERRVRHFVQMADQKETVFHRAFDICANPMETAEQLCKMGVTRILTSGCKQNALEGASMIANLQKAFNGRMQVLAGGGVRACNVKQLIEQTAVTQVHFGGTGCLQDWSALRRPDMAFGAEKLPENAAYVAVKEDTVQAVIHALKTIK
ncbi:MAG: copper homeostasis protein CutC [Oscillospiraceae bacterium]|nr:copper homeostasis protein CutC [Oscillospiraceae bacterium]